MHTSDQLPGQDPDCNPDCNPDRNPDRNPGHNSGRKAGQAENPNLWPTLSLKAQSAVAATYSMHITPSLRWFDGHFPDQPVLPGVTQTHWACLLSQDVFSLTGEITEIKKLKFKSPVLPDQHLTLELRYRQDRQQVTFEYSDEQNALSSGILQFAEPNGIS